jgi:hypothetical protein
MSTAPRGRIKGAAFREFLAWYAKTRGDAALVRAAARLPPALRQAIDDRRPVLGVIASTWYPADLVCSLLDALTEHLDAQGRTDLAEQGARAVMEHTLRGIYRTLFEWMATPSRYARFGPKLWSAYYDSGSFDIVMPDATTAICTIANWSAHHPFLCDLNRGAAFSIYESMGCDEVRVNRTECVANGAPRCRFVSTWKLPRELRG